ncbi:MAG: metal-dependent hydrolase [Gammaproteobacteria bacterium]|nr:metal-dependent hydrolase [Gammaproteobacteria bacterium]
MDPISQGALGAAAPQAVLAREKLPAFAFLGCLAGMAPDLDVFIGSSTDPLLFFEYHRQFTHALVFIPVGAALVAVLLHRFVRRTLQPRETYLACLIGYATHGLLDGCTAYGTQLFWPFSDYRVGWNNVSVIDPLFTVPLLCLAILAATLRRRALAAAGLIWALGYLLFGVVQHQRAETAGAELAAARGHQPHQLSARPGLGNLLVWRTVYEHDGRYYVDGVRTGLTVSACPGDSVPGLILRRDFPWLDPGSQQARDIERFRWFADGYLAVDPRVPHRIIDAGYSFVPNSIDMLWGIDLDPKAGPDQHVGYVQEARRDQLGRYWRLLTGEDCPVRLTAVASIIPGVEVAADLRASPLRPGRKTFGLRMQ